MDDKEFEHIAPELRRRSVTAARGCGLDTDEAEDVAQDVLLKLWLLRAELLATRAGALASVAAHNMAVDHYRRQRTVSMDNRPLLDDHHAQPDTLLEIAENEQWLERRMAKLPTTEYNVLRLRQVERRTNEEIAAILGIGAASIPTLLARARRRLLEAMKRRQLHE